MLITIKNKKTKETDILHKGERMLLNDTVRILNDTNKDIHIIMEV